MIRQNQFARIAAKKPERRRAKTKQREIQVIRFATLLKYQRQIVQAHDEIDAQQKKRQCLPPEQLLLNGARGAGEHFRAARLNVYVPGRRQVQTNLVGVLRRQRGQGARS